MGIPSMESTRELHQNLYTTHVSLNYWEFQEPNILSAGSLRDRCLLSLYRNTGSRISSSN